jgi:hypothetical protein
MLRLPALCMLRLPALCLLRLPAVWSIWVYALIVVIQL